ncbi:MAG TPA: hypothetical protein VFA04_04640 [Bryobacteraceae bacterium]|nr:hypothetical protein [Bryobacteraceae bacterium]
MGSYLEAYGAEEAHRAHRARVLKWCIIGGVAAVIVGLIFYIQFRNYTQESIVNDFIAKLRNRDYADAYRMFGCTEATPCPNYAYPKFLEDWGPHSQFGDASKASLGVTQTCGNGVLIQVDEPGKDPTSLIVDRATGQISFAPWPECPGKHWHFRQWWNSLFHKSTAS